MSTEPVSPLPNRAPMGGALQQSRIMAVLETGGFPDAGSGPDLTRVAAAADTLVANGVGCLMLTNAAAGTSRALEHLRPRLPEGVELGIGGVLTPDDVVRAAGAGARFVASAQVAPDVVHSARSCGIASYAGALTPSEVHLAWRTGATAVQLFPAGFQGSGYLSAIRRTLPAVPLIAAGGIEWKQAADWLAAGAAAVGLGRSLLGDALLPGGNLRALGVRTRLVCAAAAEAPLRPRS